MGAAEKCLWSRSKEELIYILPPSRGQKWCVQILRAIQSNETKVLQDRDTETLKVNLFLCSVRVHFRFPPAFSRLIYCIEISAIMQQATMSQLSPLFFFVFKSMTTAKVTLLKHIKLKNVIKHRLIYARGGGHFSDIFIGR